MTLGEWVRQALRAASRAEPHEATPARSGRRGAPRISTTRVPGRMGLVGVPRWAAPMTSRDTSAAAHAAQLAVLRAMGPGRRVERALEMSEQAREITIQGILARDLGLGYAEARARSLRRLLGSELYDAADPPAAPR